MRAMVTVRLSQAISCTAARAKARTYLPRTRATHVVAVMEVTCVALRRTRAKWKPSRRPWQRGSGAGHCYSSSGRDLPIAETEFHQVRNPPQSSGDEDQRVCLHRFRDDLVLPFGRSRQNVCRGFFGDKGVDPDRFPERPSSEWLTEIARRACRRIPKLRDAGFIRGLTGASTT